MAQLAVNGASGLQDAVEQKRPIPYKNLAVGAIMNIFQGKFTVCDCIGSLVSFI
jgi:hypothetical protein